MNNFSHAKPGVHLYNTYMANMPDKFGINFWLLADAQSKYLCNGKPYLGRDPSRCKCSDLPDADASEIFSSPSGCNLTIYKAKKKKVVCILSSMHGNVNIDQCHKKKLPETIQYYYKSKVGVDELDQMDRYHTSKSSSRR